MRKLFLLMVIVTVVTVGAWSMDFGTINQNLGPSSFTIDVYGGFVLDNIGANFEWGIGNIPLTLGLGLSPFIVGEYAFRAGYHPDLGVKGLDVYANLSLGIWNTFFIPVLYPQFGIHLGVRYFFGPLFGIFGEAGYSFNANFVKLGVAFKIGPKG